MVEERQQAPISEGYLYFRNLLREADSGHVQKDLSESRIVICVADFYHNSGHPITDKPPVEDENPQIILVVGRKNVCIEDLLKQENRRLAVAINEMYGINDDGVIFYLTRRQPVVKTFLGDTIQVSNNRVHPGDRYPDTDVHDFWINDPEKKAGLAISLKNRIQDSSI